MARLSLEAWSHTEPEQAAQGKDALPRQRDCCELGFEGWKAVLSAKVSF